ncbi:hypothetical protein RD792_009902 [Penstemon davidsonii]|uniref:FAD/NAD(P)-binding domain-containing protein n=1 Tax=Penstemon davidsonii TaxID=160366 RepID=A0ABR0D0H8_9LAMI|nr:hypothetical protein RD792_009902 [Penstemon davidsonii]
MPPWFRNFIQLSSTSLAQQRSPHLKPSPSIYQLWNHFSTDSKYAGLRPTKGDEKPRVVVLGSGWAGCRLLKDIDTKLYDVVCVSPRNHMVFTPLLASTCVGTLEFRSVAEPIGRIQPAISREPNSYFFLANCTSVDFHNHQIHCETVTEGVDTLDPWNFKISYDKLVIAAGAQASTFGIKGVHLVRGIVKDVQPKKIVLSDDTDIPYGLLVWSTGVGPSSFVNSLEVPKAPGGRVGIDEWLRVPSVQDVFAIGDCSGFLESTGKPVLPALAQVAERQGKYLAKLLNNLGKAGGGRADASKELDFGNPFVYKHMGSMATIGRYKALVDLRKSKVIYICDY